ncbi:hypothetical protein [Cereibacter changlensis]|uniref:hypothetical protein n=1 Tax=Cereibacter changlensis TaxID=402884 RepID=UPI004034EFD6
MRIYLTICALLLSACGEGTRTVAEVYVPPDLLEPVAGWTGPVPVNEGMLISATAAEMRGRLQCNGDKLTIAEIVLPSR